MVVTRCVFRMRSRDRGMGPTLEDMTRRTLVQQTTAPCDMCGRHLVPFAIKIESIGYACSLLCADALETRDALIHAAQPETLNITGDGVQVGDVLSVEGSGGSAQSCLIMKVEGSTLTIKNLPPKG